MAHIASPFSASAMFNTTQAMIPMDTYWGTVDRVGNLPLQLNFFEKLWASWYIYMQNDVLATGIMSFVMHEIVYFGRCLPWMIVDAIPYFNKYKLQNQKVPTPGDQWRCIKLVLLSHFTAELPQIWAFHPMCAYFDMSTSVPFPPLRTVLFQIAIFFVVEDFWHYWLHRFLHWGPMYKNVHKLHHNYSAPFGLAAEYASPIETFILGFGTVGVPIVYCAMFGGLHVMTMYAWVALRLFQAIDAHSGYDMPWSLRRWFPFWAGAYFHDEHHEKFIGNYSSSFTWWDTLFGTTSKSIAKSKEAKRAAMRAGGQHVTGEANGKANGIARNRGVYTVQE